MINTTSMLDTDASPPCMPAVSGGDDYYVIAATTITVNAMVRATGHRPLVLIASDSIIIDEGGGIDVGSHLGQGEMGAGADPPPPRCAGGTLPEQFTNSGGGAGGSFIGSGGDGGHGGHHGTDSSGSGGSGAPIISVTSITSIRGGCAGQDGAQDVAGDHPGSGGHGGGAVFLIAGNRIQVSGTILAGGEGGSTGVSTILGAGAGGGGGGAGGMIGLDAPSISVTGLLVANGGGGGEGAGILNTYATKSGDGDDSTTTVSAGGGDGSTTNAGAGGCGSPGCVPEKCVVPIHDDSSGAMGCDGSSSTGGGGGGGGGGAGLIKVHGSANLGGQVSPPPTP